MKIIKTTCPNPDENFEDRELDAIGFAHIEKAGFDLCAYWYEIGFYCGRGQLIARKDGHYYHHDMGHCSCYGPLERFDAFGTGYASLDLLLSVCSKEQAENILPCVEIIRKYEKGEL